MMLSFSSSRSNACFLTSSGMQLRCLSTRVQSSPPTVTIAGLLTSGSKKSRAANKARMYAARAASLLRNPVVAVSSVAVANVAVYGAWKAAFWCASSANSRRSAFGNKMLDFLERHFTCSVDNLRAGRLHTLITSTFSHNDIGSLFTTLNSVFSCGLPLAQMSGSGAFGKLLLASGLTSMLALVGSDWYRSRKARSSSRNEWWKPPVDPFNDTRTTREKQQQQLQGQQVARLGGSGAGTGMLTAFSMAFPHSILMLNGYVRLPVLIEVLATWIYDTANIGRENLTGVAHIGHFAGALTGSLFYLLRLRHRK